eukprot:CAMPEP_0167749782 /NCGR_PEP_ID=MMETSP0110_2-20121227/5612_1 /TAXON_ID=629695 /ORGANISM="Gymnochlora sp., Strain CCMP2014" /LENGTH=465 /DNA_ID=CAMNT_0007635001 /DNA_START=117 /DNA_END=1511 /DNA_ORIENTATION=+
MEYKSPKSPIKRVDLLESSEGVLMSESSETGGDELLRIIRGFGSQFTQRSSIDSDMSEEQDIKEEIKCCGFSRKARRRGELEQIISIGYIDAMWALQIWLNYALALWLLMHFVDTHAVAAAAIATPMMFILYLPVRRGLPTALKRMMLRYPVQSELAKSRLVCCAIVLGGSLLIIISVWWLFGVPVVLGVLSGTGRNIEQIIRFAQFSVLWLWPEVIIDILRVQFYVRRVHSIRLVDSIIAFVFPPLLMVAILYQGVGIEAMPLSLALAGGIRLLVLFTSSCAAGHLAHICFPFINSNSWQLLPSDPRPRRNSVARLIVPSDQESRGSINRTPQRAAPGNESFGELSTELAKDMLMEGGIKSWRTDAPMLLVSLIAWDLKSDTKMAAHALLIAIVYVAMNICGFPGIARATELRIKYHKSRGQMLAGRRPLVQAISFSALSMTLFTLVLTFPFMVETLLEQTELW